MHPFIRSLLIDVYFSPLWKIVPRRLVSMVYLVNFIDVNVYVNVTLLMLAIVHKLWVDTYITDRFISMTILFSTIVMRLLDIHTIMLILFIVIVHDTIVYSGDGMKYLKKGGDVNDFAYTHWQQAAAMYDNDIYDINGCDDDDDDDDDDDYNEYSDNDNYTDSAYQKSINMNKVPL